MVKDSKVDYEKDQKLELDILSALQDRDSFEMAREIGLSAEHFSSGKLRSLFEYLGMLYEKGKPFPTWADKVALWDLPELPSDRVEVYTLSQRIIDASQSRKLGEIVARNIPLIVENPNLVMANLLEELSRIQPVSKETKYYEASAIDRLNQIEERARRRREGIFIGIPTGLPVYDEDGYGIQPGELITILGKTGVGKSWLLAELCVNAYLSGKKILYLSPEMSSFETELRVDCFMMHKQGIEGVSHHALEMGEEAAVNRYRAWIAALPNDDRWVTLDSDRQGGFTIGAIYDLLFQHKPDVLAIDGFQLLAGSKSGQGWENIKANADGIKAIGLLKKLAIYNVMQVQRSVGIHENPTLEQAAYGFALIEASDKVMSLGAVRGQPDRRMLKLLKWRNQSLPPTRVHLTFNVDAGHIQQTGMEEADDIDERDF